MTALPRTRTLCYQNTTPSHPPSHPASGTLPPRRRPAPNGGPRVGGGFGVAGHGRYDRELQMFVEEPREVKREHLRFLRWLMERRQLEHPVSGPPSGALADPVPRSVSV